MPRPMYRSRTFRRILRKATLLTRLKYKRRKPSKAVCAGCKTTLHGVPRENPLKLKQNPKSQRRPQRIYGGVLCPSCTQRKIIEGVRE